MEEETFTCNECTVEFTIVHEVADGSPTVCPFCSASLQEEELDEWGAIEEEPYED